MGIKSELINLKMEQKKDSCVTLKEYFKIVLKFLQKSEQVKKVKTHKRQKYKTKNRLKNSKFNQSNHRKSARKRTKKSTKTTELTINLQ